MSSVISFGAAAAIQNPNDTYEALGYGTDGSLTLLTAAGSGNTKGSYATVGTTANAWAGFYIDIGNPNTAANRYILDIRTGGATIIMPDLYIQPGASSSGRVFVPLAVASGVLIEARVQCQTASGTLRIALSGRIASASTPPCYAQATALNADTTNTRASTTNVPYASSLGSYTQLIASTAATYGALLAVAADNGTMATTQQTAHIVATGAAASEVALGRIAAGAANAAPIMPRGFRLFEQGISSGTRIAAASLAATPGTDNARIGLYGFA